MAKLIGTFVLHGFNTDGNEVLDKIANSDIDAKFFNAHGFHTNDGKLHYEQKRIKILPKTILYRTSMTGPDHAVLRNMKDIFEDKGVRVINNATCGKLLDDKIATHQCAESLGIAQPKFLQARSGDSYQDIADRLGSTFVVKNRHGKSGVEVFLVTNEEEFIEAVWSLPGAFCAMYQEYIKESAGRDIRHYMVGDRVVDAVTRKNDTGFRSNVAQGGTVRRCKIMPEMEETSLLLARETQGEVMAIDYLIGRDGFLLCEANSNPAVFRGTAKEPSVADEIVNYYRQEINKDLE
jgi:ribosomal protein S6--L-glutamate ligase/gamma-F420-2:alpha-L-glutamate ligase